MLISNSTTILVTWVEVREAIRDTPLKFDKYWSKAALINLWNGLWKG